MSRCTRLLLPFAVLAVSLAAFTPVAGAAVDHGDRVHRHHGHARRASPVVRERTNIVRYARRFLGVPYAWGGTSPSGFDCSGFTRYVYAHFGVSLPHYTYSQFDLGRRVARAALKPGDLVFFGGVGHVGLYIGHDLFIHAPHTGTRVSVDSLSGWYSGTFAGARRLIS